MTLFKKKYMHTPSLGTSGALKQIGRNAYVDWILILAVSLTVALILIALGLHLYWKISSGNFIGSSTETTTQVKVFSEKDLNSIIDKYEIKEGISGEARRGYKGPADPSL